MAGVRIWGAEAAGGHPSAAWRGLARAKLTVLSARAVLVEVRTNALRHLLGVAALSAACGRIGFEELVPPGAHSGQVGSVGDAVAGAAGEGHAAGGAAGGATGRAVAPGSAWCPALSGEWTLTTPEPLTNVNGDYRDAEPSLSADGLTLYYSSVGTRGIDSFAATRPDISSPFGPGTQASFNTWGSELKFLVMRDGLTALLNVAGEDADFVWLTRADPDSEWIELAEVTSLNSSYDEWDPWLSADGLRLYYMTLRPDVGTGSKDLVVAERPTIDGDFGAAVELAGVNSADEEADPTLTPDELFLIFSRVGEAHVGGADLYYAIRNGPGEAFSDPVPLPMGDVSAFDVEPAISTVPCEIFFSRDPDATDPRGLLDLHRSQIVSVP